MSETSPSVQEGAPTSAAVAPDNESEEEMISVSSPLRIIISDTVRLEERRSVSLRWMLVGRGSRPFDAFSMVLSNQMSQMLVLLPSCVAKLGWWTPLVTAIIGLLSCWTAHLVQGFYSQYYTTDDWIIRDDQNEKLQWDEVLSNRFRGRGNCANVPGKLAMGFNGLCQLTRCVIQLTYAASIIYFFIGKMEKRNWTIALAFCCLPFAAIPNLRKYRMFSLLSLVTATVAAVSVAVASLRHKSVQRIEHSVASSSMWSDWAWVSSIIAYTFGDTPVSVETLVTIRDPGNQRKFEYWFLGSTAYATVLSLLEALSSYWVFGDELSKISPAAQPCALAVLPPSHWRDAASISLLILELVAISHSFSPLFMYLEKVKLRVRPCSEGIRHFCACASVVILVCIIATAIPFSGSMEITSLVGSFIVGPAVYIIPAVAYMYLKYCDNGAAGLSVCALPSYVINIIQIAGGLIFVTIMGGLLTSIKRVFFSHNFHHSDFWNRCYLCADLWLSPALTPISAPAPSQFVKFLTNNISISKSTCC